MHEFAVKVIGDEDDAYDYIKQFDGEMMDKAQAAFDKDCEEVYYFKCFCPEEHKDEAEEAGTIFREEQITEQYEENWGKIAEVCPLEELQGKDIESIVIFEADEEGLTLKKQIDMREGYTREEFLDEFSAWDVENTFGLEFPEDVVGEDEQDEFYYDVFIIRLENKLWDSPKAEETKFQLGSILSFWEDVV